MGEKQNGPFQLSFNPSLKVDFQGSTGHLGWRSDSGARVGRTFGPRRTDRATPD